jgi:quercetin dioxygenase-like cupin family protein
MKLRNIIAAGFSLFVAAGGSLADDQASNAAFVHLQIDEIRFQPVAELPGLEVATLAGDPGKPGPYVVRVRFGPGLQTPPHFHDQDRFVSVISGVWAFGVGESGDCANTIPLRAGAFAMHPKGAVHFDGSCDGAEVIVQITGIGPVETHWLGSQP